MYLEVLLPNRSLVARRKPLIQRSQGLTNVFSGSRLRSVNHELIGDCDNNQQTSGADRAR